MSIDVETPTQTPGGVDSKGRGWSGIAFGVLYVAGFMPLGELLGSFGDPDATFGYVASVFVFLLGPSVMGILGVPVWVVAVSAHWLRGGSTRAVRPATG